MESTNIEKTSKLEKNIFPFNIKDKELFKEKLEEIKARKFKKKEIKEIDPELKKKKIEAIKKLRNNALKSKKINQFLGDSLNKKLEELEIKLEKEISAEQNANQQ